MDRDYRVTAKAHGFTIEKAKGDDLAEFRIERARLRNSWYFVALAIASIAGYGWALHAEVVCRNSLLRLRNFWLILLQHVAVPLTIQFFIGASITVIFNMCGALLTDIHPENPATAQASSNIIRCALSAAGLAALQELIAHIGPGWTFTVFAAVCLVTIPMIMTEIHWGFQWRKERVIKKNARSGTALEQHNR